MSTESVKLSPKWIGLQVSFIWVVVGLMILGHSQMAGVVALGAEVLSAMGSR